MQKKTVLFFSRLELTFLYGSLHEHLKDLYNIIHVAYSVEEAKILENQFGISGAIVFKDLTGKYLAEQVDKILLRKIDDLLIAESSGTFNFNTMLQSNRTSKYIGYENSVKAACMYYNTWDAILSAGKVDFFVHEPVSLMMNQLAWAVCKQQGGIYTTHILINGDKGGYHFMMVDDYNGKPAELNYLYESLTQSEITATKKRVENYLQKFRGSYDVFFSELGNGEANFKLRLKIGTSYFRQTLKRIIKPQRFDNVVDNVELFIYEDNLARRRFKNLARYSDIKYDELDISLPYYFYPMHLEPEAVVLYWGGGFYTNQVKLIENIAAQLPPGFFLYVKDHPHLYGYRDRADYERIQSIPNVKLLKPSLSGKRVIKDCCGVITLNGTGGFEALLMNKHVVTFGSVFYQASQRVKNIANIKQLRQVLYKLQGVVYTDDDELYRFVLAFLKSQKKGFTNFYGGMHKSLDIDLEANATDVSQALQKFFTEYPAFEGRKPSVD